MSPFEAAKFNEHKVIEQHHNHSYPPFQIITRLKQLFFSEVKQPLISCIASYYRTFFLRIQRIQPVAKNMILISCFIDGCFYGLFLFCFAVSLGVLLMFSKTTGRDNFFFF